MLGKNDQKIGGDEAAWFWRFFFRGRMWHVELLFFLISFWLFGKFVLNTVVSWKRWYQMGERYSRSLIDSLDCPSTGWQEFQRCLAVEYVSNFEYLSMPGCPTTKKSKKTVFLLVPAIPEIPQLCVSTKDLEAHLKMDQQHLWHPYTSMTKPTRVWPVCSAHGCSLHLEDGRQLVDGMASWWCAIHGYNVPELNAAATKQLSKMSHAPWTKIWSMNAGIGFERGLFHCLLNLLERFSHLGQTAGLVGPWGGLRSYAQFPLNLVEQFLYLDLFSPTKRDLGSSWL